MQLSIDPNFPGYKPDNWELDVTIWLDGVQQHKAIALDTEKRTLVVAPEGYGYITTEGHIEVRDGMTGKVIAASPPPQPKKEIKGNDTGRAIPRGKDAPRRGYRKRGRW